MQNPYEAQARLNYNYKKADVSQEFLYNQYEVMKQAGQQNKEKYEKFIERIKLFEKVNTLIDAKELAKKILPTAKEVSEFKIGSAKCTIINKEDCFRICVQAPHEFISYDFI